MPVTTHRSDYGAVFFVKTRITFGAFLRDLNDSERQELQTNRGAVARVIVDGSPAFNSDILVGDVITAIDSVPVVNAANLNEMVDENRGKKVTLSFIRRGQNLVKDVQLTY